eukprot:g2668.t1
MPKSERPKALHGRLKRLPAGDLKPVLRELEFGLLTSVPHPVSIDLSGVSLNQSTSRYGPEGMNLLAIFLARNSSVQELRLGHCDLCRQELHVLAPAVKVHPCLRELHLPHNRLSEESPNYCFHKQTQGRDFSGLRALALAIREHPTLAVLDLAQAGVSTASVAPAQAERRAREAARAAGAGEMEAAEALADAVVRNGVLRRVTLERAPLNLPLLAGGERGSRKARSAGGRKASGGGGGGGGGGAVGDSATALNLRDAGLVEADIVVLAALLAGNDVVTALDLSDNAVGDGRAAELLVAAVGRSATLTSVGLANGGLGPRAGGGCWRRCWRARARCTGST